MMLAWYTVYIIHCVCTVYSVHHRKAISMFCSGVMPLNDVSNKRDSSFKREYIDDSIKQPRFLRFLYMQSRDAFHIHQFQNTLSRICSSTHTRQTGKSTFSLSLCVYDQSAKLLNPICLGLPMSSPFCNQQTQRRRII